MNCLTIFAYHQLFDCKSIFFEDQMLAKITSNIEFAFVAKVATSSFLVPNILYVNSFVGKGGGDRNSELPAR
jgi:hypothetical protein